MFKRNPVNPTTNDEDFRDKIQDMRMFKKMGIQTWIGRMCLKHQEIITSKLENPQILMVELEKQDAIIELTKGQTRDGVSRATKTFQAHNQKRKKLSTISREMTYLTNVNLHLELAMATPKMLEIGEDSAEYLEVEDDDNGDNERNLDIWQDVNCLMVFEWKKVVWWVYNTRINKIKKCILNYY